MSLLTPRGNVTQTSDSDFIKRAVIAGEGELNGEYAGASMKLCHMNEYIMNKSTRCTWVRNSLGKFVFWKKED